MTNFLYSIGMPGLVLLLLLSIVLVIAIFKAVLRYESSQAKSYQYALLEKKYPGVDVRMYKGLIFNISVALTLGFVILLFEFPSAEEAALVELTANRSDQVEMQEIPLTEHKTPPPPVIKSPEIVAVADEIEIEQEMKIDFSTEANEDAIVEETEVVIREEKIEAPKEEIEEVFQIVEEPAAPIGGYDEFYAFIGKNLEYPRKALDLNISGKVYVRFVVDKDGSLTKLEVLRGIGFGCDEEALRVLSQAPKWKPGKQRGRAVKQQMVIPIVFVMASI